MNKKKFIYKFLSPRIGKLIDTLFLTDFARTGLNYYHRYNINDYQFDKDEICFVHVSKTGGMSLKNYLRKHEKIYIFEKRAEHNPVSLLCPPKEYKYITFIRNPVDRVHSYYNMFLNGYKEPVALNGLSNFLRNHFGGRNLYCQYFTGYIGEHVNDYIYELALENLKNFYFVGDFDNYSTEVKRLLNKLNMNYENDIHENKSNKRPISEKERKLIQAYNYYDLKLFDNFKKLNTS